jgi:hypothetical protein
MQVSGTLKTIAYDRERRKLRLSLDCFAVARNDGPRGAANRERYYIVADPFQIDFGRLGNRDFHSALAPAKDSYLAVKRSNTALADFTRPASASAIQLSKAAFKAWSRFSRSSTSRTPLRRTSLLEL